MQPKIRQLLEDIAQKISEARKTLTGEKNE